MPLHPIASRQGLASAGVVGVRVVEVHWRGKRVVTVN